MSKIISQFIQQGIQRDLQYGEPVRRAAGVAAMFAVTQPQMTQAAGYPGSDSYQAPSQSRVNLNVPRRGTFASEEFKSFPKMPSQAQPSAEKTGNALENFAKRIGANVRTRRTDIKPGNYAGKYTRDNTDGIKNEVQKHFRVPNFFRSGVNSGHEQRDIGTAGPKADTKAANFNRYEPAPQAPIE